MSDPLRRLPDIIADLTPDVRNVWLAFGLSICLLLAALTWIGVSQSSPIRAAEAAVRERLEAPDVELESRFHYLNPLADAPPHGGVLVCGSIDGHKPYGALVMTRRRHRARSLIGPGDRVMDLALGGAPDLTAAQAGLLVACAERS